MGCSTSRSNDADNDIDDRQHVENQIGFMTPTLEKLLTSKNPEDLLSAFTQLDQGILEEENRSPSSVFGQAMSWQRLLKTHFQSELEIKAKNEILSEECSILDLFEDLGLTKNPKIAAEHEEFVASINRRAINQNTINTFQKIIESVEEQIKNSSDRISQLQSAYQQQDELLGQIFGETYGSETEKQLEKQLDTMRYYRDILAIGVLQWELCANNVQTAVSLLQKGLASWKSLKNQELEKKIFLGTEIRNSLQKAVLLVQASEELLQDVQFPFCTTRELKGISQATEYVFTDILIEERYLYATEVYKNFHQRAISLHEWIKHVLHSRLKKDLLEIEDRVSKTARELRNERIYLICKKLKIENPPKGILEDLQKSAVKSYGDNKPQVINFDEFPINLESKLGLNQDRTVEEFDVQNYFQRIIENRKNTMWPSRRIDELQSLALQQ